MDSFLQRIARAFYDNFGADISRFTFVFPNRRAGIFFRKYVIEIADINLFMPEIQTIDDCVFSASAFAQADKLSMLFALYRIYREISQRDETFDDFVFWGEMLLADFDEMDKFDVDARQLFTNITELKEIEHNFDYLTENQIKAIRQFWENFHPENEDSTENNFMSMWKILFPLYEQFRAELLQNSKATSGMLYKLLATKLKNKEDIPEWGNKSFVFIGFNALNKCEKIIFTELLKLGKADFYWDYESKIVNDPDNPSSHFIAENRSVFYSKLQVAENETTKNEKEVHLIAVPSSVGQAKQIYEILNNIYPVDVPDADFTETGVILPDENLLIPLLNSVPEQVSKINVTMGFPLKVTSVAGFIEAVFDLKRRKRVDASGQTLFYHHSVSNVLNHDYITSVCRNEAVEILSFIAQNNSIYIEKTYFETHPLLREIFSEEDMKQGFTSYLLRILKLLLYENDETENGLSTLDKEFIYQYYITLNRMNDILTEKSEQIAVSQDTLIRLIRQLIAGISIPFVGEPLEGLQIMGVLEARGLDFKNLIISSFNEGILPSRNLSGSFIPYNLRKGFGLPTYEYHDAVTSYNFYRLIHQPERIFFIYDSRSDGSQTGEVSRFLYQLEYLYGWNIRRKNISYVFKTKDKKKISIRKTPDVMAKLLQFTVESDEQRALSASSINTYIDCPLKFYLSNIEGLREADEISETIEEDMFGTLFHGIMEGIFNTYTGKTVTATVLDDIINNEPLILKEITRAFASYYFKKDADAKIVIEGNNLLIANVLKKYIVRFIDMEKQNTPYIYLGSEKEYKIKFPLYEGRFKVNIKGYIDRVDEKEGKIRIMDYKTGSGGLSFNSLEEVFRHNMDKRPKYVLQTFLYALLYKGKAGGKEIQPGIIYLKDIFKQGFDSTLTLKVDKYKTFPVTSFNAFEEEFTNRLAECLEEIFRPEVPFYQCSNTKPCEYCTFKTICNR